MFPVFLYFLKFCPKCYNVPVVALDVRVGARLHKVLEKWVALGASPKVIKVLREGYTVPVQIRLNQIRSPAIKNYCVNPIWNSYLMEALHTCAKNAVEPFTTEKSLGFYN